MVNGRRLALAPFESHIVVGHHAQALGAREDVLAGLGAANRFVDGASRALLRVSAARADSPSQARDAVADRNLVGRLELAFVPHELLECQALLAEVERLNRLVGGDETRRLRSSMRPSACTMSSSARSYTRG
jgi:hypothetical protein